MTGSKHILDFISANSSEPAARSRKFALEETMTNMLNKITNHDHVDLSLTEKVANHLSATELDRCALGILAVRINALLEEGKCLLAMREILDTLSDNPQSFELHMILPKVLSTNHNYLIQLGRSAIADPTIEQIFLELYKCGSMNFESALIYTQHLVTHRRFDEAEKMALRLIRVTPNILGLARVVEAIAEKTLSAELFIYLNSREVIAPIFSWIQRDDLTPKKRTQELCGV